MAQSISTVRPAYRIPLDTLPEEGRTPIELWQESVKHQTSSGVPPERSSGGSSSIDSEVEAPPDHILQSDYDHGARRQRSHERQGSARGYKIRRVVRSQDSSRRDVVTYHSPRNSPRLTNRPPPPATRFEDQQRGFITVAGSSSS